MACIRPVLALLLLQCGYISSCPAIVPQCSCTYKSLGVSTSQYVKCSGLNSDAGLPEFQSSTISTELFEVTESSLSEIQDDAFIYLKPRAIKLVGLGIQRIGSGAFNGTASFLEQLFLAENLLEVLPGSLFQGLLYLSHLRLSKNKLSQLDASSFVSQENLLVLYLDGNTLSTLPDGLFDKTTELEELHLDNNQLTFLVESIFSKLTKLVVLDLSLNRIRVIPKNLFQTTTRLADLRLQGNTITQLDHNTFTILQSLQKLNMSSNGLITVDRMVLTNCVELTLLDLSHNNISNLNLVINSLIEYINLASNSLRQIEFDASLHRLKKLYLQHNNIDNVPENLLKDSTTLQEVDLSQNSIQSLMSYSFPASEKLVSLNLSFNQIGKENFGFFGEMPGLLWVDVTQNNVDDDFIEALTRCNKLTLLYASHNRITTVNEFIKNWSELRELRMDANNIGDIEIGFLDYNAKLEVLCLSKNSIKSLTRLGGMSLIKLNLSDNKIDTVAPRTLEDCIRLQELDLHNNNIRLLPLILLKQLSYLQLLDLGNNQIEMISSNFFSDNTALEKLILSGNRIANIDAVMLQSLGNMNLLDLSTNSLTTLQSDALPQGSDKFRQLYIAGNPFICSCEIDWLKSYRYFIDSNVTLCSVSLETRASTLLICSPVFCNETTTDTTADNQLSASEMAAQELFCKQLLTSTTVVHNPLTTVQETTVISANTKSASENSSFPFFVYIIIVVIVVVIVVAIVIIVMLVRRRSRKQQEEKFPALEGEQFDVDNNYNRSSLATNSTVDDEDAENTFEVPPNDASFAHFKVPGSQKDAAFRRSNFLQNANTARHHDDNNTATTTEGSSADIVKITDEGPGNSFEGPYDDQAFSHFKVPGALKEVTWRNSKFPQNMDTPSPRTDLPAADTLILSHDQQGEPSFAYAQYNNVSDFSSKPIDKPDKWIKSKIELNKSE